MIFYLLTSSAFHFISCDEDDDDDDDVGDESFDELKTKTKYTN
jgi:hypothetical protein